MTGKRNILFTFELIVSILSIVLFLLGFFPLIRYDNTIATFNDIPHTIENVILKTDEIYEPKIKKLIIMVIDALRWDFVAGPLGKLAMPLTNDIIENSSACLFKTKVHSPTVTMPRIKAIVTGTVSSFVEVALNLGSKPIEGDSFLLQAKQQNKTIVFLGDETWLKLYPKLFDRYEGTTSFFVTDFTEVDDNVTRHLNQELEKDDWSILILHYLGLDHIGHVHGPFSSYIKPKLKEMDDIINKIHSKVVQLNRNNHSTMFLVTGDHGMKDSGGHGGSTEAEVTVPSVIIGTNCTRHVNQPIEISQIDLTSTLAVILGLPIPRSNIGSIILPLINNFTPSEQLFLLYYNAKQVLSKFEFIQDYKSQFAYEKYVEAVKLHIAWLNSDQKLDYLFKNTLNSYKTAIEGMQRLLVQSILKYDYYLMATAIFLLFQVLYVLSNEMDISLKITKKKLIVITLNIFILLMITHYSKISNTTVLYMNNIILQLVIIICIIINSCLMANIKILISIKNWLNKSKYIKISHFCHLTHAISLGSSSFIEEEHQLWYFLWVTVILLYFYDYSKIFVQSSTKNYQPPSTIFIRIVFILTSHRFLRKLNSNGDKFAHLPHISGWLKDQNNTIGMTFFLIVALVILLWISITIEEKQYKFPTFIFNSLLAICIYLRHMANNSVMNIFYYSSRGINEVRIFWIIFLISIIISALKLISIARYKKTKLFHKLILFSIQFWITLNALLHQPHNVILLPMQILYNAFIYKLLKDCERLELITYMYTWIGYNFYFYQGNTNSLATIDLAAGYVGLESYDPLITGLYLTINVYSAHVIAILSAFYYGTIGGKYKTHDLKTTVAEPYIKWRLMTLFIYLIIVGVHRYHLFIWTVFSPKLLYEAYHTVFLSIIIIVAMIISEKTVNKCIIKSY